MGKCPLELLDFSPFWCCQEALGLMHASAQETGNLRREKPLVEGSGRVANASKGLQCNDDNTWRADSEAPLGGSLVVNIMIVASRIAGTATITNGHLHPV